MKKRFDLSIFICRKFKEILHISNSKLRKNFQDIYVVLKYGDCYMTSRIIVENHVAGCFEYLMCQQMAPKA